MSEREAPSLLSVEKRRYRRAFWTGLGISALAHAVLYLWVAGRLWLPGGPRVQLPPPPLRPPEGMLVIEVRPLTPEEEEAARQERRLIDLSEPQPEPERPTAEQPRPEGAPVQAAPSGDGEDEVGLTNAERLRPRMGDPKLWDRDAGPMPEYLEDSWLRAEGRLRDYLSRQLDSLNLSEEQRRKAVEWLTGEDDEWGVTPDGIRLGGIEIPMNVGALFQEEGPRGREARQLQMDRLLIDQQDLRSDVEATIRERNAEMEQRSDAERARQAAADSAARADSIAAASPR